MTGPAARIDLSILTSQVRSPATVRRYLRQAAHHHAGETKRLRRCLAEDDRPGAFRIAQGLKGLAGQLGAPALFEASQEAAERWRRGEDAPPALVERLLAAAAETLEAMCAHLASLPDPATGAVAESSPQDLVRRLERQLHEADAEAIRTAEALARLLGEAAREIEALVGRFEFTAAARQLGALRDRLEDPAR